MGKPDKQTAFLYYKTVIAHPFTFFNFLPSSMHFSSLLIAVLRPAGPSSLRIGAFCLTEAGYHSRFAPG